MVYVVCPRKLYFIYLIMSDAGFRVTAYSSIKSAYCASSSLSLNHFFPRETPHNSHLHVNLKLSLFYPLAHFLILIDDGGLVQGKETSRDEVEGLPGLAVLLGGEEVFHKTDERMTTVLLTDGDKLDAVDDGGTQGRVEDVPEGKRAESNFLAITFDNEAAEEE